MAWTCLTVSALGVSVATLQPHIQGSPVLPVSPCGRSPRLGQQLLSMSMFGDKPDNWWGAPPAGNRDAAYRAQLRALRSPGHLQSQRPAINRPRSTTADSEPPPVAHKFEAAWVVIFNAGQRNEGVYTQVQDGGEAAVVAFEFNDDAEEFARSLFSKGFDLGTPSFWSAGQMTSFCHASGFDVSVVPRGTLPEPPSNSGHPDDIGNGSGPERSASNTARRDEYNEYRGWLDALFILDPNCDEDDCIIR